MSGTPKRRLADGNALDAGLKDEPLAPAQAAAESGLRRRAEPDVSNTRYFDFYDLAPVGYIAVSARGLILHANLATATLLGVARDALVKQTISRFITEEDQDIYCQMRKRIMATGKPHSCELRLVRHGGTQFWARLDAVAAEGIKGAPVIRCVIVDVTERKQTEVMLHERIKEQQCLIGISVLLDSDWSLAKKLQGCAERLPNGWLYSDIASARVTLNGMSYQMSNFRETYWRQSAAIEVGGTPVGKVEVHYLEERPCQDNGPFLKEERGLLDEIARRIGSAVERESAHIFSKARLRIAELDSSGRDMNEILRAAIDAAEAITSSQIGFVHFVAADEVSLTLQVWSTNTLAHMCAAEGAGRHYPLGEAGVWADCVRTRAPAIHNDYAGLAHRRGLPEGHARVTRELVLPVLRNGKVALIFGVGNKAGDYCQSDVNAMQAIAETVQAVVERRLIEADLRASEARWQFALEAAGDGVWDWNTETNRVFYSPHWKSMLGFAPEDLGDALEAWRTLVHPQDIDSVMSEIYRHLSGTTPSYAFEYRLRCKDGSYKWVLDRGKVVERTLDGRSLRAIGTHTDITERKLNEQAQRDSAERFSALSRRLLEVQEEERALLARELHDEIGQVLTAVRLHLKVVERGDAPEGSIGKALKAVEGAIKQVRGLSLNLRPPVLDELGLVAALHSLAQKYSEASSIRVRVEAPTEEIALHQGLTEAAYRIAQEALTNAIRHGQVREAVVCVEPSTAELTVSVRDDGCGFDPEEVRRHGGFGLLGMEERARLAGGKLRVRSEPGKGTEVRAKFLRKA